MSPPPQKAIGGERGCDTVGTGSGGPRGCDAVELGPARPQGCDTGVGSCPGAGAQRGWGRGCLGGLWGCRGDRDGDGWPRRGVPWPHTMSPPPLQGEEGDGSIEAAQPGLLIN